MTKFISKDKYVQISSCLMHTITQRKQARKLKLRAKEL